MVPPVFQAPPGGPLTVLIIGAGIGGLSAAIALRRAGHNVHVYERSGFANEIGAAISVGPNASRVLEKFGYSSERLGGVPCLYGEVLDKSGTVVHSMDHRDTPKTHGAPWYLAHRADLHSELKHLALSPSTSPNPPCSLHLSTQVTSIDPLAGIITYNGLQTAPVHGDLIIGADGIHSTTRHTIFPEATPAVLTGYSAFRFIIPTSKILADPETVRFAPHANRWTMWIVVDGEKRIVIYPCRRGELLNFSCIHPDESRKGAGSKEEWDVSLNVDTLSAVYADFAPVFHRLFALLSTDDVKLWQIRDRGPLKTWIKGRVALLGDACHPMMPHLGQGGGQAIEDGAALGVLFPLGIGPADVPARLKLYEHVRKARAETMQELSRTPIMGIGKVMQVSPVQIQSFLFAHDVTAYATQSMSAIFIPQEGGGLQLAGRLPEAILGGSGQPILGITSVRAP